MNRLIPIFALTLATLATGCSYTPGHADPDPIPSKQYPKIVTLGWLDNDFYYDAPIVKQEEATGKPLKVSVSVRRLEPAWNRELPCQYRFIFFDEDGAALDPDPTWHYRSMEPKVATILQGSAPDSGAVDWRCEIRKDRAERKRTLFRWY